MQKVLITGATGFLGSHLLKSLLVSGYKVIVLKRSTSNTQRIQAYLDQVDIYDADTAELADIFKTHTVDAIVHTACHYGRNADSVVKVVESNLMFGLELHHLAIEYGVRRFINIDTLMPRSLNAYSRSKKQLVEWLNAYSHSLPCINLRVEHMYGPGDDSKKFLPWLIDALANKVPSIDLTAGEQLRDFIYIDDVVAAILLIIEQSNTLDSFCELDVASGTYTSLRRFVEAVKQAYEASFGLVITQLNFGVVSYREGEPMQVEVDIRKLHQLGWLPKESLETGIKKTIENL